MEYLYSKVTKKNVYAFSTVELIISSSILLLTLGFFSTGMPQLKKMSVDLSTAYAIEHINTAKIFVEKYYSDPDNWNPPPGNVSFNPFKSYGENQVGNYKVSINQTNVRYLSGVIQEEDQYVKKLDLLVEYGLPGAGKRKMYERSIYVFRDLPEQISEANMAIEKQSITSNVFLLTVTGRNGADKVRLIPIAWDVVEGDGEFTYCLLYTSPSPRDS